MLQETETQKSCTIQKEDYQPHKDNPSIVSPPHGRNSTSDMYIVVAGWVKVFEDPNELKPDGSL